ncbi:MAG: YkgJ family cysteine cluster protein [Sulfurimonas sp.]|nr:YkgJ family cysteine cluster protein [Sulfurimonas sp.]
MSDLMSQEGYPYRFNPSACETCQGKCCTGESGYIYVTMAEIEKIAALLEMDVKKFAGEYLFKNGYKYSIKEQLHNDSHECVFYDRNSNGCKIYEARPLQCRTFPFWDYFKTRVDELKLECPGIVDV